MKGGLHYGFRSSRSKEVYPGAQQTGHRRRAEAERFGSCPDVCDGGMGEIFPPMFLIPERYH